MYFSQDILSIVYVLILYFFFIIYQNAFFALFVPVPFILKTKIRPDNPSGWKVICKCCSEGVSASVCVQMGVPAKLIHALISIY